MNNKKRSLLVSLSLIAVVLLAAGIILTSGNSSFADTFTPEPSQASESTSDMSEEDIPDSDIDTPETDDPSSNLDTSKIDDVPDWMIRLSDSATKIVQVTNLDDNSDLRNCFFGGGAHSEYDLSGIAGNTDLIIRGKISGYEIYREATDDGVTVNLPYQIALIDVHEVISRPASEAPIIASPDNTSDRTNALNAVSQVSDGSVLRVRVELAYKLDMNEDGLKIIHYGPNTNLFPDSEMLFMLTYFSESLISEITPFTLIDELHLCFPVDVNGNALLSNIESVYLDEMVLYKHLSNTGFNARSVSDAILAERRAHSHDLWSFGKINCWQEAVGGTNE